MTRQPATLYDAVQDFLSEHYPNNGSGLTTELVWQVPESAFGPLRGAWESATSDPGKIPTEPAADSSHRVRWERRIEAAARDPEAVRLRAALLAYVAAQSRMRDNWAEGDDAVKRDLWQRLHECEEPARQALAASPEPAEPRHTEGQGEVCDPSCPHWDWAKSRATSPEPAERLDDE